MSETLTVICLAIFHISKDLQDINFSFQDLIKCFFVSVGEETYPQAKTTKKRGKKRRFLEGSEIDSCSIPQSGRRNGWFHF